MTANMYQIWLHLYYKFPEGEIQGLLNLVREWIKHVYGINLLDTALKKSALVQTSKNTEKSGFLYFKASERIHARCTVCNSRIRS